MPVIQEGNRLYFWFDHNKPRREEGRQEALRRWADARGDKEISRKAWHSIHHISVDRSQGNADNLFVCESEDQHNKLHSQLQEFTTWAYNIGLLKFDFTKKKYYVEPDKIFK